MADLDREEWRRRQRERRESRTDRELLLEVLERLDGLAIVIGHWAGETMRVDQEVKTHKRQSSAAIQAVTGRCIHAGEHVAAGACACPASCHCKGVMCS